MPDTAVHSPAGIRLVVGLVGPFLTEAGQREVEDRWGVSAETLFKESLDITATLESHDAVHAALGVWTRDHVIPAEAAARVGHLLKELPADPAQAQQVLDGWAAAYTNGMIEKFPCQVTDDTHAVLASAVAVEDAWVRPGTEKQVQFAGDRVAGFEALAADTEARSTPERDAVRVTLPLESGLVMTFVTAVDPERAPDLLGTPEVFTEAVVAGQRFVTVQQSRRDSTDVAVHLPTFTTRSSLDLCETAAQWGLAEALKPYGVPGLGDLEVTDAKQDAFIEVTHTGVRAAAVTAMMMMRSASMITPVTFDQRVVAFDGPFAYEIRLPGYDTALFTGVYAG